LIKWDNIPIPLPTVASSLEWYQGQRDYLAPAKVVSAAA
jgi:6-phosphogluconate dehydrogenase